MALFIMIGAVVYLAIDVGGTKPEAINPYEFAFVCLVAVVAAIRSTKE